MFVCTPTKDLCFNSIQNVAEDTFELPMDQPIRPHLLRRISRISGAFTQDFGPRKVSPPSQAVHSPALISSHFLDSRVFQRQ